MKRKTTNYLNFFFFTIVIFLFWTCSPKLSYDVTSFLFDGVPNPYKVELTVMNDSLAKLKELRKDSTFRPIVVKNEYNLHPPYQKRNCSTCHSRKSMGKTILPIPELCNRCHDDFNEKNTNVHGPITTGNCTACHNPHQSKLKNLLKLDGKELCFNCHSATLVEDSKVHKGIDKINCIECHNPHGSSQKFNLENKSCYKCHDNFEKEFPILHGPVASNNCSNCHDSHSSSSENLLLKSGQKLCYSCHNFSEIEAKKYHQTLKSESCTKCHNPHGGSSSNFLLIKQP
ncbi:MAG: hypothetical protein JKY16_01895 [Lutibacter sp.]|nr:hypothetical protein [Lutibacter sp.]